MAMLIKMLQLRNFFTQKNFLIEELPFFKCLKIFNNVFGCCYQSGFGIHYRDSNWSKSVSTPNTENRNLRIAKKSRNQHKKYI